MSVWLDFFLSEATFFLKYSFLLRPEGGSNKVKLCFAEVTNPDGHSWGWTSL